MKNKIAVMVGIEIIVLICIIVLAVYIVKCPPVKIIEYNNEYFNIETYISSVDKDNDGIDDQTDFLNSVKEYIAKKPIYQSKYYNTGYPDDEYGVCTDVIAFGCLGAGYDLRELVNEHILNNRELYDIENVDKNIDFRRVTNLKVYLDNNAISLTTDISDFKEWQGGDIIVFKKHIGVISDRRNSRGIPFVIHHANPLQRAYEEDFLEFRDDIVGHYRLT